MTSGSATLTSTLANFQQSDVGKLVVVEGAGASSATLTGTIRSVSSTTSATLSKAASTTVSSVQAIWASDDTEAINDALEEEYTVLFPTGIYGATAIRLRSGNQIVGEGIDTTTISRMALGSGAEFVGMTSGELAQKVRIENISISCNQIGANNHGLALGTEGNAYAFANGSYINNVRVTSASGIGAYINSNVGFIGQLWVQNFPGSGTPDALSIPNSSGFKSEDATLYAGLISVEGRFENGDVILNAGGGRIENIQMQLNGSYASKDAITFGGSVQSVGSMYSYSGGTRRDFIRILTGIQAIRVDNVYINDTPSPTFTNTLNDVQNSITLPYDASHRFLPYYYSDTGNKVAYDDQTVIYTTKPVTTAGYTSGVSTGTSGTFSTVTVVNGLVTSGS